MDFMKDDMGSQGPLATKYQDLRIVDYLNVWADLTYLYICKLYICIFAYLFICILYICSICGSSKDSTD